MTASIADPSAERTLELVDVQRGFGGTRGGRVEALRGVSLAVRRGQVVGLVGPDGAGKTTLLRVCAGLLVADSGTSTLLGLDSARDTIELRNRIGYMPQKFGLYQDLSVAENLGLYADLQGVATGERPARFAELLGMTGLTPFQDRLAGKLSGGMKQKLGLACALVKSPELLLLDEPTVGVDPVSRRDLWDIVYRLVGEHGIGVLVATAYMDEAERCDRVAVMFDGEVVAEDAPAALAGEMAGRVVEITCPDQRAARDVQGRLSRRASVADARIVSGRVRAVRARGAEEEWLGDLEGVDARPVEACFEDAFMDMAHARGGSAPDPVTLLAPPATPTPAPRRDPEVIVRVRDLSKRFGDFVAVRGIHFDVRRGEIFGLLGPNGAGKTTTFRMLCGLLAASGGELGVAGHDLRRAAAHARSRLGYMAQSFSLYGQLSVEENLRFFGKAYGLGRRKLTERIAWAYEEFGLTDRAADAAGTLPGGYKQRLAMATALLHEPDVLFLDEPTSGVDALARREFWQRISAASAGGVTVIVTTHFMEEAEYCDRMLIMSRGEPMAMGDPAAIRGLGRTDARPDPTIEDAFVALSLGEVDPAGTAADPGVSP